MTTTPQTPNDRFDRIEATLERFAELTFQNAARYDSTLKRHDHALSRIEANADRHDHALSRLEANSVRHDDAIAQLLEVTSRNSEAVNRHDGALNRMESAITNMADRLDRSIEQSAAERETMISEIREIWRYLRYEPGNGRSGTENG